MESIIQSTSVKENIFANRYRKSQSDSICEQLRAAIFEGMDAFHQSDKHDNVVRLHNFMKNAGFRESGLEDVIPSPSYDNAAREIGLPLNNKCRELGIHLDYPFPGSFDASKESHVGSNEARGFSMDLFYSGEKSPFARLKLCFPHSHENFEFIGYPVVTFENLDSTAT